MPLRAVILHHRAAHESRQAECYYRRRSSSASQRFRQAVNDVIQRIAATAEQGAPFQQYFRWMQVKRFPYVLYYEIRDPHPIFVYAVAHTSRRPGYWHRRRSP